jgi:Major Facilitator Superfamily
MQDLTPAGRRGSLVLAVSAGLALADASVVALALPALLRELDTTVEGVAAVLGVYVLVLALTLIPAAAFERRHGAARVGAAGLALMTVASLLCAVAGSLPVLLVGRALQAAGGAAGLIAIFTLIDAGGRGRRLWVAAAVFGTAAGPALGGLLTQALSWRAIFVAQAPVALAAAIVAYRAEREHDEHDERVPAPAAGPMPAAPAAALALVAAALTAVLFLLVLELVAGWAVEPLAAAGAVTVLPVTALAASRWRGPALIRATAGAVLIGAGTLCLAFLPDASVAWTIVPQILAGAGMGLALPALSGELVPERTAGDAARLLTVRHAGIVLVLAVVAPVVSHQLDNATHTARLRGIALVLDAKLPPQAKLPLAPALLTSVNTESPREGLRKAIRDARAGFSGEDAATFDTMAKRADDTLVAAVGDAFNEAFWVAGALGLAAACVLVGAGGALAARGRWALGLAAVALAAVPVYAALHRSVAPEPVKIADPCKPRALPHTGGLTGALQDTALVQLDRSACRIGSSREELVLALVDPHEATRFERRYGVNPRSIGGLISTLFG